MKSTLVSTLFLIVVAAFLTGVTSALAQEKMTKDEWQSEMASTTQKVTDLQSQLKKLNDDTKSLQDQSTKLDADVKACQDALYALLGVTQADVDAFDKELTDMENRVAELQRMSDAELSQHKDEVQKLDARLKEMAKSKIALIPRYGDRVKSLQDKVTALLASMQHEKNLYGRYLVEKPGLPLEYCEEEGHLCKCLDVAENLAGQPRYDQGSGCHKTKMGVEDSGRK